MTDSKPNFPKIRITFGNLLYETASKDGYQVRKKDNPELVFPEIDEVKKRVSDYQAAWQEKEEIILKGLTDILELDFFQNAIDVYIAPFMQPISEPLILHTLREPDSFIDALSHELLHRLFTDNTQNIPYGEIIKKMYPEEVMMVRNHVVIFAVLKYLFLDVLKEPHRLERKVRFHQKSPPYKRAWEIVESQDYREIINSFKSHYTQ
jgi:hypothetical protein